MERKEDKKKKNMIGIDIILPNHSFGPMPNTWRP